jgi:uncharacterized protein YjdB
MLVRRYLQGFLLAGLVPLLAGCNSPELVSIAITPSTQYFTFSTGLSVQFRAIGTYDQGDHPVTTQDITDEVTWKSNSPDIATVSSTGLVAPAAIAYGTAIVSATMNGFTGTIVGNSTVNVCAPGQILSAGACTTP